MKRGSITGRFSNIIYYAYLMPLIFLALTFVFYPLSQSFYYIFIEWDGFGEKKFVGLQNFFRMASDRRFLEALIANLIYVLFFTAIPIILGLILTMAIGSRGSRLSGIFRIALLVPLAMTAPAIGTTFYTIFSPSGLLNEILSLVSGPTRIAWLGSTSSARVAIGLVGSWSTLGFATILFFASIQRIPQSLIEIADLEGASMLQKMRYVILPFVLPMIVFVLLFSIIGALGTTSFGIVSALTQGAYYTRPLAQYGHEVAFKQLEVGYGASIIFIPALIGIILSYLIYRVE